MKVAITGSTSTGKTTLANELMKDFRIKERLEIVLNADARSIIRELGCRSMDIMTREQNREFQILYFKKKKKMENNLENFLVERSFVDVAAYWLIRDTYDLGIEEQDKLIFPCYEESKKYDLHIYLPFGLIPFEDDGYRPSNIEFNKEICRQTKKFLTEWNLNYIEIKTGDLEQRINIVTKEILKLTK